MQPYIFPYLGYYQLAYDAETYVFLDDVTFIKQGFINRNSIILQGKRHNFSLPVLDISSNRNICDHQYIADLSKVFKLIQSAYRKAPFFTVVMPLIESVLLHEDQNVARKNARSVTTVFEYLGLKRNFLFSSAIETAAESKGQTRILALCHSLGVSHYRNAIGGRVLYDTAAFEAEGINLRFIDSTFPPYNQGTKEFISHLSIIDILMNCDKSEILEQLASYSLAR